VLADYQAQRSVEVLACRTRRCNAMEWFEHVDRYCDPARPSSSCTRCSRAASASATRTCACATGWLERYERWFAQRAGGRWPTPAQAPIPPMFTPFTLRGLTVLKNRVVVSPMAQYSAVDGVPGDFHLVHLGARALGGAGWSRRDDLPEPRRPHHPGCCGLWNDTQRDAWKRIVDFVHATSPAKVGLQLGHAGAKGSTCRPWEGGDRPAARHATGRCCRRRRCGTSPAPARAARDDARRHGRVTDDFVRARCAPPRPASTGSNCTARTATCCRASCRR
jgi:anthraniloyl-CoA monooxygenase